MKVPSWVAEAQKSLQQPLTYHTSNEYTGAKCPVCGDGTDRLVVFEKGNVWCRRCGYKGWWSEQEREVKGKKQKTPPDKRSWLEYYNNPLSREKWGHRGITTEEIDRWGLGYDSNRNSLTIPVYYNGNLVDIRHRLEDTTNGKYRSEGITHLFNTDSILSEQVILLVEGEIKTILLSRVYRSIIGLPGVKYSIDGYFGKVHPSQTVVLALDPGSSKDESRLYKDLTGMGIHCMIAAFFDKPDDILLEFGESIVREIINQAR